MNQLRTLCVMGAFDDAANHAVSRIKEKLQAQGIAVDDYEPHITLGIYTSLEEAPLLNWVASVSAQRQSIRLCFNHFGFFPDAVHCFLAPCPNDDLLGLHAHIREKYDSRCTDNGCLYSLYQKSWTPHMTLATIAPGQAEALLTIFRKDFSPFTAELTQLKITASDTRGYVGVFDLRRECGVL